MATDSVSNADAITKKDQNTASSLISGKLRRNIRENLVAYLFLAPAVTLIFTFGIFPIFYAGYVSLFKWRIRQGEYLGLDNYINSMGDVGYIFFGLVILALVAVAGSNLWSMVQTARERDIPIAFPFYALIPAAITGIGIALIMLRAVTIFAQSDELVLGNATLGLLLTIVGTLGAIYLDRWKHTVAAKSAYSILPSFNAQAITTFLAASAAVILFQFTLRHLLGSERLPVALIRLRFVSFGLIAFVIAYMIWRWSMRQESLFRLFGGLFGAAGLIGAGAYLVSIWPSVSADSDPDFYLSLSVTIFFSLGTVPLQLGISMLLANLLFQNLRFKGALRIIFFIPYIAPAVATAGIFEAIFSIRPTSIANLPFTAGGVNPEAALNWLKEPQPAFAVFGDLWGIPIMSAIDFGPSLALVVIILYNVWVYVGYDTVIFLAGLGNISSTLYEAAKIDGAGRWQLFRHITLPLLSPTTYFLSVISVIGTFKAFNAIWVLRDTAALGTTDTASVYFFATFIRGTRYGYATAMAVVLFVIILTLYLIQRRIAATRVFYG